MPKNMYSCLPIEDDIPEKEQTASKKDIKTLEQINPIIHTYAFYHMSGEWGYDEDMAYELAKREYQDDLAWSSISRK